eukprot:3440-Heterococcus_DN1.PRE.1
MNSTQNLLVVVQTPCTCVRFGAKSQAWPVQISRFRSPFFVRETDRRVGNCTQAYDKDNVYTGKWDDNWRGLGTIKFKNEAAPSFFVTAVLPVVCVVLMLVAWLAQLAMSAATLNYYSVMHTHGITAYIYSRIRSPTELAEPY